MNKMTDVDFETNHKELIELTTFDERAFDRELKRDAEKSLENAFKELEKKSLFEKILDIICFNW